MTQGGEEGQERFEDTVLLLPDEESEYGVGNCKRDMGGGGNRDQESEVRITKCISRMGRAISKRPGIFN